MQYKALVIAAKKPPNANEYKPLMRLGTSTIIENVIQNFQGADVTDITVVTGYKAEILEKYLAGKGIDFCFNRNFAESHMMDSICLGLRQLGEDFDYVLITPGDVPLVKPETIRAMLCRRAEVVRVSLDGRAGHPVMLSKGVAKEILNYHEDGGLRSFLERYRDVTAYVNVDDQGILLKADTSEDYKNLRKLDIEHKSSGGLWLDMRVSINKKDFILTPETAQFLKMIDCTGSLRMACSAMYMSYTKGWQLLNRMEEDLGYKLVARTAGGEKGGRSELTTEGRQLLERYHAFMEELTQVANDLFTKNFSGGAQ